MTRADGLVGGFGSRASGSKLWRRCPRRGLPATTLRTPVRIRLLQGSPEERRRNQPSRPSLPLSTSSRSATPGSLRPNIGWARRAQVGSSQAVDH